MSSIAILADIHGNVPALEAVVDDLRRQRVDEVLVGGDLVGRGPQGSLVARRIRELGWPSVRGNHEDYLVTFRRGQVPADWREAEEWSAARWMAAELTQEDARYLESLPFSLVAESTPRVRLVHGSPRSNNDGIGPWTSDHRLAEHLERIEEPVLVCGHTHRPLQRRIPRGLIVNVGSVGLPFNGDRRAQYALLHVAAGGIDVELRRVAYDVERTIAIYRSSGFLSAGGATARLLKMELERAQPFLVPFLHWAAALNIHPDIEQIEAFCEFYDPDESMRSFSCRLRQLQGRSQDLSRRRGR